MSSIIKTGCAPSNTPDGKYFLQTDQACYAELKRGRTYIMTAQEEAKVSHYVIITNADFTVTFNGDSDLVQVGLANNAIVMNVQRACRIDFTQGGNLEFKEGTADLSSTITMGPNASGNVLVASSLPQQGDFAGQICSLTTGATYVWTGSQWSSTAGSSTLPSASVNGGMLLAVNGSWTVSRYPSWRRLQSNTTLTSGKWVPFKLLTITDTSGQIHLAFDIQSGSHIKSSRKCHVEFFAPDALLLASGGVWVTEMATGQVSGASVTSIAPDTVRMYVNSTTNEVYLAIRAIGQGPMVATITNFVTNDGFTTGSSWYINQSATDVETLTDLTLIANKCYVTVPVSTASNQMLVSDGNGGWKVLAAGAVGTTLKMTSDGPAWST